MTETGWLALSIGNSRLHWGLLDDRHLLQTWHCPHIDLHAYQDRNDQSAPQWQAVLPPFFSYKNLENHPYSLYPEQWPELWLISVVPTQSGFWDSYPNLNTLKLSDVPLQGIYPSLGLDRAIALWGAGTTYGWPCLVIDGGTALTLTGADASASLIGGAILPGLQLQFRALASATAALSWVELPQELPALWSKDTAIATQSGVVRMTIAGIRHAMTQWLKTYPDSKIVFTGGDAEQLSIYTETWIREYEALDPNPNHFMTDPALIFKGMQALRKHRLNQQ
jgi:type III pantothenate kinase